MKNRYRGPIFILLLASIALVAGCSPSGSGGATLGSADYAEIDERIAELGEPQYEIVSGASFEILPFPGLEYNGIRDAKHAFYAANKDYTFAIYTDQEIMSAGKTFDETMQYYKDLYSAFSPECSRISTASWITEAEAFSCGYYASSIDADYKITVFYHDGESFETILGVWGTDLGDYEYIYDSFNRKAVKIDWSG